ncbi:MAG: TRAP transporter permease DctQ, partial [Proteobacteria bacterium]
MRRRWQAAVDGAATASLVVAGAALVGLAVVQAWQVFARYLLNASPSWTEPVALLLMSTIMMFGAAVGVHREAHFGFFLLIETASPRVRRALRVYTRLVA